MAYKIITGDALSVLKEMDAESVQCCITSPPYWGLRDYDVEGQLGLEKTPEEYVQHLVEVFREVWRVLRDDGTLWLNLGDSYGGAAGNTCGPGAGGGTQRGIKKFGGAIGGKCKAGCRSKDLVGIPWRVAFALQAGGWYLRQDIIWHKPNPMPESVRDRCTKAHEYIFLLSKNKKYYYDREPIREKPKPGNKGMMRAPKCGKDRPGYKTLANDSGNVNIKQYAEIKGANRRSVWTVTTKPYKAAHFATFPPELVEPCLLAGCPEGGVVLDPFAGSGTVLGVAEKHGRDSVGIELNLDYCKLIEDRVKYILER